jgi:hypothetical protein
MRKLSLTLLAVAVACPALARAQGERGDARVRERCREAADLLESGPRHPKHRWALHFILRCDVSGAPALASRWPVVEGRDTSYLGGLAYASRVLRDGRLLRALVELIGQSTRPRAVRLAALDVLVSYYAVGRTLPSAAADPGIDVKWCVMGGQADYYVRDGAVPITAADRPSIMQAVEAVAATDTDPIVQHAAACAAAGMRIL